MPATTLTPTVTSTFPAGASYTLDQFANAFAARLSFTLPSASVLWGQLGGSEPLAALPGNGATAGLWFNSNTLFAWNTDSSKYLPLPPVAGQLVNGTIYRTEFQTSNVSSNTILTAPADKSGTLALAADVLTVLGCQTLTYAATVNLDWSIKQAAYVVLGGSITVSFLNQVDGQVQDLFVENPTSNAYTVAFATATGTIIWPTAGTQPVQTAGKVNKRTIDYYQFKQSGLVSFARAIAQDYEINLSGGGSDTTPPTVSSIIGLGGSTKIFITFSKLLAGATIPAGDFSVKKAGVAQTVSSVVASGATLTITLSATYKASNSLTVQYTGADIKDVAGNQAANFGPSAVTISSGGSTGGGGNNNSG